MLLILLLPRGIVRPVQGTKDAPIVPIPSRWRERVCNLALVVVVLLLLEYKNHKKSQKKKNEIQRFFHAIKVIPPQQRRSAAFPCMPPRSFHNDLRRFFHTSRSFHDNKVDGSNHASRSWFFHSVNGVLSCYLEALVEGQEESAAPAHRSEKYRAPQGDGVVLARLTPRKKKSGGGGGAIDQRVPHDWYIREAEPTPGWHKKKRRNPRTCGGTHKGMYILVDCCGCDAGSQTCWGRHHAG